MWGLRRAVTCLAVVAAAGLRAHALPPSTVSADALHAVENSVDSIGGAPTYVAAAQDLDPELEAGISNAGDWKLFTGVPVTGIIKSDDGSSVVQLSSYYKDDRRIEKGDEHYAAAGPSYYAATTVQTYKPAVFIFDVEEDGLLLQAVDCINSVPVTPGLFVGAHNIFETDLKYRGYVRVMVQRNPEWSIIWEVVKVEGKKYLRVKKNRFPPASKSVGWYMAVPPDSTRNKKSNYLAITADIKKAMAITLEAYGDDEAPTGESNE